ncbi:MAG: cell division ATP-binding protein FtsE [Anaerotignaceae bacterium]
MIELKNVYKTYEGNGFGVTDVSIKVGNGEFIFFTGRTGSGKTTILNLITGDVKPTSGNVIVEDISVADIQKKAFCYYRRLFGVISSEFPLLENRTVYENLEIPLLVVGKSGRVIRETIPRALGLVGMTHCIDEYPINLSIGEKSKVLIARAVLNNPKFIVADEPTASLDYDSGWDIMCLFKEINKLGITVIIATHAKEFVNVMGKRVVTLDRGRIAYDVLNGKYGSVR